MSQEKETLRYDKMVEDALRSVVKKTIEEIVAEGELPGSHHFYITFATEFPGVSIPKYLHERYPGEMTIVLQYQYEGLYVDDEILQVTLYFNNKPEKLTVPLKAISIFADPSVNFALQFQPLDDDQSDDILIDEIDAAMGDMDDMDNDDIDPDDGSGGGKSKKKSKSQKKDKKDKEEKGEVVSLDTFRKKK